MTACRPAWPSNWPGGGGDPRKIRAAALRYAARGLAVFPLIGKDPAIKGGHGFKDASTDPAVINRWFDQYPRITGIGAPTDNGRFVLDIDPGKSGEDSLDVLIVHL